MHRCAIDANLASIEVRMLDLKRHLIVVKISGGRKSRDAQHRRGARFTEDRIRAIQKSHPGAVDRRPLAIGRNVILKHRDSQCSPIVRTHALDVHIAQIDHRLRIHTPP